MIWTHVESSMQRSEAGHVATEATAAAITTQRTTDRTTGPPPLLATKTSQFSNMSRMSDWCFTELSYERQEEDASIAVQEMKKAMSTADGCMREYKNEEHERSSFGANQMIAADVHNSTKPCRINPSHVNRIVHVKNEERMEELHRIQGTAAKQVACPTFKNVTVKKEVFGGPDSGLLDDEMTQQASEVNNDQHAECMRPPTPRARGEASGTKVSPDGTATNTDEPKSPKFTDIEESFLGDREKAAACRLSRRERRSLQGLLLLPYSEVASAIQFVRIPQFDLSCPTKDKKYGGISKHDHIDQRKQVHIERGELDPAKLNPCIKKQSRDSRSFADERINKKQRTAPETRKKDENRSEEEKGQKSDEELRSKPTDQTHEIPVCRLSLGSTRPSKSDESDVVNLKRHDSLKAHGLKQGQFDRAEPGLGAHERCAHKKASQPSKSVSFAAVAMHQGDNSAPGKSLLKIKDDPASHGGKNDTEQRHPRVYTEYSWPHQPMQPWREQQYMLPSYPPQFASCITPAFLASQSSQWTLMAHNNIETFDMRHQPGGIGSIRRAVPVEISFPSLAYNMSFRTPPYGGQSTQVKTEP